MIDTVRFKTILPRNKADLIFQYANHLPRKLLSKQKINPDPTKRQEHYQSLNFDLPIELNPTTSTGYLFSGSYNYHVKVFVSHISPTTSVLNLEWSSPKYAYGHNLEEITTPHTVKRQLQSILERLTPTNDTPLDPEDFHLKRLDLCKNINLLTPDHVYKAINHYKAIKIQGKTPNPNYKTTAFWKYTKYSMKYYAKYDEFQKHDALQLAKQGVEPDYIHQLHQKSKNIIRFEVTLRTEKLFEIYRTRTPTMQEFLKNDKILIQTLKSYMDKTKMFDNNATTTELINVAKALNKAYPNQPKAVRLYQFYVTYYTDLSSRLYLQDTIPTSTIYRLIADLKKANIPLTEYGELSEVGVSSSRNDTETPHTKSMF